jgi:hypothetical protein
MTIARRSASKGYAGEIWNVPDEMRMLVSRVKT